VSVIDVIGTPVAQVLKGIHSGLSTVLDPASGWAWGLSIVLLTVFVRLLLFPLFVKQIKSQRRMQELAPKIKELQKVHKGDRETLNTEMMKLYKDNNANPISGCLPLLLQLPVFFALFSVIREFRPQSNGQPAEARFGLSADDLAEGGRASIFGAPVAAALNSSADFIAQLGAVPGTVRVVAVTMLVLMGATTFWTQRQMMARATTTDPTQQTVQKVLLYVLPLSFAIFGYSFPIGVLLYWLTTNIWSMGQQAYVIKRMPPPVLDGPAPGAPRSVPAKGGKVDLAKGGQPGGDGGSRGVAVAEPAPVGPGSKGPGSTGPGTASGSGSRPVAGPGSPRRAAGSRKNKSRRGGRR
jgi:YidC/Oxa1 family membrane protein insertase